MPVIRFENWDHGPTRVLALGKALRAACATAGVPGLESEKDVTVLPGAPRMFPDDKVVLITVDLLYVRTERTRDHRDTLVRLLAEAARPFVGRADRIEVFCRTFATSTESSYFLEPEDPANGP